MNTESKITINYPALVVTVIYPVIIIILAIIYGNKYEIGKFEIISIIATYYIINISVGVGLHRMWSHGAFKTKAWVEVIFAFITAATLQGPILAWASDHMLHHKYTDEDKDPHTALKYKNKFVGFLWSHMGWMIFSDTAHKKIDRLALVKLGKNKVVLWQFKHYWKIAIAMNTIVPMVLGYWIGGDIKHAISAFIFMGLGRAIQQQATFCVNSVVHINMGTQKYYYGTARDIWWLFWMLLGENWHNFHHAFASDYRNGHKWYHFDAHKWIIAAMHKLGLATDLVVTSKVRIKSMKEEVQRKTAAALQNKLELIENAVAYIHSVALDKLKATEESAVKLASDFNNNLNILSRRAKQTLQYVEDLKSRASSLEESVMLDLYNKYDKLKKAAIKLEIQVGNL